MHTHEAVRAIANIKGYYIAKHEEDTFGYRPKGVFLPISDRCLSHPTHQIFFDG